MDKYAKQHNLVKDNTGYHYQSPDVIITAPKLVKRWKKLLRAYYLVIKIVYQVKEYVG
jgi:hypothetical protein